MSEGLTLETLEDAVQQWRSRLDGSKIPSVLHICGPDRFYYRVLNALRSELPIPYQPDTTWHGADVWRGIRIQRHKDHGETDAVCVEMADGSLLMLDPRGGDDDDPEVRDHE